MSTPAASPKTEAPAASPFKRAKQLVFLCLTLGILGLSFPVFNIFSKQLSLDNHENRLLTGLPTVLQSSLGELPNNLNSFLADNSPFRYQLVLANATLNYQVFDCVESSQVLLGKEDWLFYKDGPDAATPLANYQGLLRMDENELEYMADNLQTLANAFWSKGGQLVVSFAPSKDLIYPEYVPDCYPRLSETDLTQQVADYLSLHTGVPISYAPELLFERKISHQLYFKYDTHWNHVGALIFLDDALHQLGISTPRFVDYDFVENGHQAGDMANVAALYNILQEEPDYYPANYAPAQDPRTVIVYGDSFSEYYMPYLQARFANVWRDELANLNRNTLPDSGADIVIIEANERSFDTLFAVLEPH